MISAIAPGVTPSAALARGERMIRFCAPQYWWYARVGIGSAAGKFTWTDRVAGAVMTRANVGADPAMATSALLGSQPVVDLRPSGTAINLSCDRFTTDSASTITAVLVKRSALSGAQTILQNDKQALLTHIVGSDTWGTYNGGDVSAGEAVPIGSGVSLIMRASTANSVKFQRGTTDLGTKTTGTAYNARGRCDICPPSQNVDMLLASVCYWPTAISDSVLAQYLAGVKLIYGI